jgi:hypothetical protein
MSETKLHIHTKPQTKLIELQYHFLKLKHKMTYYAVKKFCSVLLVPCRESERLTNVCCCRSSECIPVMGVLPPYGPLEL